MNTANRAHIDSTDKAGRAPSKDIRPATLFLSALSEADANAKILSSADETGYRSILELLQYMTHETGGIDELSPAGFFSSICFESALVDDKTRQQRKIHLTRGARHFFEKQIAKHWFHQVDYDLMQTTTSTGAGLGRREESGSIPKLLARYIDSYFLRNHKEHLRERCRFTSNRTQAAANIPIWCNIYHCLRSGNLNLAIDELSNYLGPSNPSTSTATSGAGHDGRDSIYFILECISKRLQNISIDLDRLLKAMEYIRNIYKREINEREDKIDPFHILVLNLLGFIDNRDLSGEMIPEFNFEDFVWCHLWFIDIQRLLIPSSSAAVTGQLGNAGSNSGLSGNVDHKYNFKSPFKQMSHMSANQDYKSG